MYSNEEYVNKWRAIYLLAYCLIRTIMAQAACIYGVYLCTISLKGSLQSLKAFQDSYVMFLKHSSELKCFCKGLNYFLLRPLILTSNPSAIANTNQASIRVILTEKIPKIGIMIKVVAKPIPINIS